MKPWILGPRVVVLVAVACTLYGTSLHAQQPGKLVPDVGQPPADAATSTLHQQFAEQMSNVKLIGQFTVVGRDNDKLSKEEYVIRKVEKLPEGDKWMFLCRIKYGQHDVEVPLPIDVKWAGQTPIITLDDLTIPGLGTFSSRVVIHERKYAGTWRHDKVGGHLFGTIEKVEPAPAASGVAPAANSPAK